ncbi:MAG: MFS transporter [Anaerolineales bacterium]
MTHRTFSIKQYGLNTFSSLKIRNYRLYYIGQIISTSGTFMQLIAQAWLVLKLTDSGTALGVVTALQYLPILFLGPYGGLIADRFSKRTILYLTQSISGLLALILGLLVATGWVTLWSVYVLAFALGLVSAVDNPTRQSFVVEMVGETELRNAVTLYSSLVNLARVIGPAIAAATIAAFGLAPCFIVNGLSYGAVVIMLYRMNSGELKLAPPLARSHGQVRQGFQYVLGKPVLRDSLLMMVIIGTLTFEFQVSLPLIARFTFNGNASSYAMLSSAMGIGAVAGGLFIAGQKMVSFQKLVSAALLFGLAVLAASFMPSLALTGAVMVLVGIASIGFTSLGNSLLQLASDPQMRGRVMSFWSMAFLGSSTIGGPIVGWFGEFIGPRWGLAIGGLAGLIAAALGWLAVHRAAENGATA